MKGRRPSLTLFASICMVSCGVVRKHLPACCSSSHVSILTLERLPLLCNIPPDADTYGQEQWPVRRTTLRCRWSKCWRISRGKPASRNKVAGTSAEHPGPPSAADSSSTCPQRSSRALSVFAFRSSRPTGTTRTLSGRRLPTSPRTRSANSLSWSSAHVPSSRALRRPLYLSAEAHQARCLNHPQRPRRHARLRHLSPVQGTCSRLRGYPTVVKLEKMSGRQRLEGKCIMELSARQDQP